MGLPLLRLRTGANRTGSSNDLRVAGKLGEFITKLTGSGFLVRDDVVLRACCL